MNTKRYIEAALLEQLRRGSIDKVKVNEIIRIVGTCKGTFYKYYRDKYELLISCFRNNFYDDIVAKSANWEEFTFNCLSAFEKSPSTVLNAFDSLDVNSVRYYHEQLVFGYLTADIRKHSDVEPQDEFALKVCSAAYTEIMLDWLSHGTQRSKEQVMDDMRSSMPHTIYPKIYDEIGASA